jgi:hypothetical protein
MTLKHQAFYVDAHRLIPECLVTIKRGVAPRGLLYQTFVLEWGTDAGLPIQTSCLARNMNTYSNTIPSQSYKARFFGLCEGERTLGYFLPAFQA